ncbi:unknown protein [Parachlamydia acanthamoebae UV-7]|uniref:Uncharacterized protein n=1 Tax=Parachlamydia acanthamoebae (strain UV7) TaxID=765952 RepID=F8KZV1_PARAV|nr:hypothetical protein [Parachlamydia acanthamoebae]CCB86460.1 unknown protein [Parachlamydia acanthamoebae UV-7]
MAKCKYQTLAAKTKVLLTGIDQYIEKSSKAIQGVQFHFYEKFLWIGVPPPSKSSFDQQVKAHLMGMRILSPSIDLRAACNRDLFFGFYLPLKHRFLSQCLEAKSNQSFIRLWGVKTTLPSEMQPLINKSYWELFLYCPESSEYSNEIDWFEKENYTNSLTFQMDSALTIIGRENAGKAIIRKNLDQLALPYFQSIIEKWRNDPEGHDTIPKDIAIVFTKPFAPTEKDYIAHAYEKVRRELRKRSLRNYENLMILWRDFLENLMFVNVAWTSNEKDRFIKKWELNIFGSSIKNAKKSEGRWEQAMTIDQQSTGKIIKYFLDKFLANPSKEKRNGEIACLLWTLIWLAQDSEAKGFTVSQVLALDAINLHKEQPVIIFGNNLIEISLGLYQLLQVLKGNGQGRRSRLLFPNLSPDYLQHMLKEASLALFGTNSIPILPAAFLSFPHQIEGMRFSKKEREHFRSVNPGPAASHSRRQILKAFREIR